MNYLDWRNELFNRNICDDPVTMEMTEDFHKVSDINKFKFLTEALNDNEIISSFNRRQIGIGLNYLFHNCCSDYPYIFRTTSAKNILHLNILYEKYFLAFCTSPIKDRIGAETDDSIDWLCYMFWDIFIIFPGFDTADHINYSYKVMTKQLHSTNEQIICSSIHGLGHFAFYDNRSEIILNNWLKSPTTKNEILINYAEIAKSGMIN
jgi:hypothetical protein